MGGRETDWEKLRNTLSPIWVLVHKLKSDGVLKGHKLERMLEHSYDAIEDANRLIERLNRRDRR